MTDIKYPKGERVFTGYYSKTGELLFIVTSKEPAREWYYLYAVENGAFKRLGKAREPPELEARFRVYEKMTGKVDSATLS